MSIHFSDEKLHQFAKHFQGDAEQTEEIQLKPTINEGKSSKQEKNRIKNLRFSFAPSNISVSE